MALDLTLHQWIIASIAAFGIGISKSGIKGLGTLIVTVFALLFGSKLSTGIVLPMLWIGDIFAITYYRRHVNWHLFFKIFPSMIVGVLIGAIIGKDLPEGIFKYGMAAIIFISVGILLWWERRRPTTIPDHWSFGVSLGTLGGVTTMVGNLAGAFVNLFFLAMRIPKTEFIGTAAWLFFFVNLIKLPFHIWSWGTITRDSLMIDLYLLFPIVLGLIVGVRVVKKINESFYRKLILFLTALGAIMILLK